MISNRPGECMAQMSMPSLCEGAVVQASSAPSDGEGKYVNAYDDLRKSGWQGLPCTRIGLKLPPCGVRA
jgi:hypothetical protein